MDIRHALFSFKGRLRRRDWWLWSIASSIVYVAVVAIVALVLGADPSSPDFMAPASIGAPIGALLTGAAIQAPFVFVQAALGAKRAQDRNYRAWPVIGLVLFTAAAGFVPDGGFAAWGRLADQGAGWAWALLGLGLLNVVASLYLLVVLGILDGTPGPNRFGRSPKGIGGEPADRAAEVFS